MAAFIRSTPSATKQAFAEERVAKFKAEQERLKAAAASRRAAAEARSSQSRRAQANTPQARGPRGRTAR